jgi:CO/xanthine dehydrogenase FAD-binding subunit
MALDIMPTSFWRRRFEQALVGQALLAENIEAVSQAVVDDLGDDLLCDIFASVDYRRAAAPIYKRAVSLAAGRA